MRSFVLIALLACGTVPSFAVTVTTSDGCTSSVPGITSTLTFDSSSAVDPAGHAVYSGTVAFNGGTNPCGSGWLFQNGSTTTITFDQPIDYFGTAWGSKDSYNSIQLFNGDTPVGSTYTGSIGGSPYVNFFADAGEQFTRVVLSSSGCCFETDNHSYRLAADASEVPEPGSMLTVVAGSVAVLLRRRLVSRHQ